EDTAQMPVSAYGRTKAVGETLALENNPQTYVVRTAWLYGQHGPNFAKTMLKLAGARDELTVVDDQVGQPTWTLDLARQIVLLLDSKGPFGIYHGTNAGAVSWFGFARAIFANAGLDPERVKPTDSSAFVRPAPRPAYSVLGHSAWEAAGLGTLRSWDEALAEAMRQGVVEP
ncbi:MAG: rfbD, partial [Glaciihabitans sp.]|nr:rfbD [Glaciihabitans sp.]